MKTHHSAYPIIMVLMACTALIPSAKSVISDPIDKLHQGDGLAVPSPMITAGL